MGHILAHVIFSLLQCQKAAVRGARQLTHKAPGAGALLWEKEYAKSILNITVVTSCFNSWYKSQPAPWAEDVYIHFTVLSQALLGMTVSTRPAVKDHSFCFKLFSVLNTVLCHYTV